MFMYEKKLQYPVKIDKPNPRLASIIISQYGGPDGELGASLRYLSQRFSMPFDELKGLLTDIGTEAWETAHANYRLSGGNAKSCPHLSFGHGCFCLRPLGSLRSMLRKMLRPSPHRSDTAGSDGRCGCHPLPDRFSSFRRLTPAHRSVRCFASIGECLGCRH